MRNDITRRTYGRNTYGDQETRNRYEGGRTASNRQSGRSNSPWSGRFNYAAQDEAYGRGDNRDYGSQTYSRDHDNTYQGSDRYENAGGNYAYDRSNSDWDEENDYREDQGDFSLFDNPGEYDYDEREEGRFEETGSGNYRGDNYGYNRNIGRPGIPGANRYSEQGFTRNYASGNDMGFAATGRSGNGSSHRSSSYNGNGSRYGSRDGSANWNGRTSEREDQSIRGRARHRGYSKRGPRSSEY